MKTPNIFYTPPKLYLNNIPLIQNWCIDGSNASGTNNQNCQPTGNNASSLNCQHGTANANAEFSGNCKSGIGAMGMNSSACSSGNVIDTHSGAGYTCNTGIAATACGSGSTTS